MREKNKCTFPKNVCQPCKTIFDELELFAISCTDKQKGSNRKKSSEKEPICKQENFSDIVITTWISLHIAKYVSLGLKFDRRLNFSVQLQSEGLVESFLDASDGTATKGKSEMKLKILETVKLVKNKPNPSLLILNQRRCRKERLTDFEVKCREED